jgi:cyclic di-GMP phosphodiesterase
VPQRSERRPLVLIVDDEAAIRSTLARFLTAEGCDVTTEGDGNGALDAARLLHPDVVLLDVQMPGVDGFEVCRRMKADPELRLTPVVMVTGQADLEHRVRGLDAGADDFLAKPVARVELLARVRSLIRMKQYTDELERTESVLISLARSIEGKDPSTEGHCERLSAWAAALGRRLHLGAEEITALERAGALHDIGKVAVPDAILLKAGPLTEDEWAVMRKHPLTGEQICAPIRSLQAVLPIIRHHHERCDGSGYPDGLRGIEIPVSARVLQVVDVYDALTTERSYKPALSPAAAFATMTAEVARGWWDQDVFGEFRGLLDSEQGRTLGAP